MTSVRVVQVIVVITALGCAASAVVWGRSSRRNERAWRRIAAEVDNHGRGADARDLARSQARKEAHTAALYVVMAVIAVVLAFSAPEPGALVVAAMLVPVGVTFRSGPRLLADARVAEHQAALERRAEEVLSQEELAPLRWAARLAPPELPPMDGFEVGRVYEPGTGMMAGDFYDLYQTSSTRTAVVIGDVTGHGIEPSITAFQVKYLLRVFLRNYRDPAQALEELNAVMSAQGRPEEFVSLVAAVFDTDAGTLRYASAGHPAHARPQGGLHEPRGRARHGRPAAALHRRSGRGQGWRGALRRGAHCVDHAARPRSGHQGLVQDAARRRPGLRRRPTDRRPRHPGHPPGVRCPGAPTSPRVRLPPPLR